ncbi:IPT/TIG domain-containing protein [Actinoplanes sp. DH11]|uniref:IPT/TIG domain-containing protein n=1 Tax=Actinoplanes sp. DH11 TaxID=2857011 RepID=UPI001E39EC4E|nr:IPT/TIG domain-containing protein [Actinoplanes sp. DH11]
MSYRTRARRATALATAVVAGLAVVVVHPGTVLAAGGAPGSARTRTAADYLPVVARLEPDSGPVTGGTAVTVRGRNLSELSRDDPEAVMFGAVPATRFVIVSDVELLAISPPGANGAAAVRVKSIYGAGTATVDFRYRTPLGVEFDSVEAGAAGGTSIVVAVTGGTAGATAAEFRAMKITAKVGGTTATVAWVDPEHVRITVPATTRAAAVPIVLAQDGLAGPESTGTVNYLPSVTRVAPARIETAGGATVQITGAGFLGVDPADPSAVAFGDTPAASFTVVSATQINAVAPPGAAGYAAVRVTAAGGTSPASDVARVSYRGPLGLDTADGRQFVRAGGGQHVLAVTGGTLGADAKAFTAERISVRMGTRKLTTAYVDATHLRVTLPAMTTATADLQLVQDTLAGPVVTFPVAPVVTALSPAVGTVAGGKTVKVTVAGTGEPTGFMFGANPATCTAQKPTVHICTVPATTAAGPVAVSFTSAAGEPSRFTAAATFAYTDLD